MLSDLQVIPQAAASAGAIVRKQNKPSQAFWDFYGLEVGVLRKHGIVTVTSREFSEVYS